MAQYKFDVKNTTNELIQWIRDWFRQNGNGCKAVLGMSGGKDSTITAALLAKAIGPQNVIGVMMPDRFQELNEADEICQYLGIKCVKASIENLTEAMRDTFIITEDVWILNEFSKQAEQNIPPRLRMTMLYAISQTLNGRVVNTCNYSENFIGYETIFGDSAGDFSPLGNLTVTEVLAIGDYLELPEKWVHKTPDDGLPHSTSDEEKLGFTYAHLDDFIRGEGLPCNDLERKMADMHYNTSYKREPMATYKPNRDLLYQPFDNVGVNEAPLGYDEPENICCSLKTKGECLKEYLQEEEEEI